MSLPDITGHAREREALLQDLRTDNVAHAYLFTGEKSLGKFTVAKWFASMLLTADARDPDDAHRIREHMKKLIHPDYLVIDKLWVEDGAEDVDDIAKYSNIPQQHRAKSHARTDTIGIDD